MSRIGLAVLAWTVLGLVGCGDMTQSADGEYTILMQNFTGITHVEQSKYYKIATESRTGWEGLYVVHQDSKSELYWGKYATVKAASRNLWTAKEWRAPTGANIYAMAIVVRIPGMDIGPPEWNLRNAQGKYTVVVAMYYNLPAQGLTPAYTKRKEDAVDYCKQLRQAGIEAYFLHEAAKSFVTIGTFPESAIASSGRTLETVGAILDPRMQEILKHYPKLRVNAEGVYEYIYVTNPRTRQKEKIVSVSYPMEIPHEEGTTGVAPHSRPGHSQPR